MSLKIKNIKELDEKLVEEKEMREKLEKEMRNEKLKKELKNKN